MQFIFQAAQDVKSRSRAPEKTRFLAPSADTTCGESFCEHQTYYEKTYSLNSGHPSLRHGSVVLHDRTRHHDYDDTYGDSRHAHSDQHQHDRDAPEHGGRGY